MEKQRDKAAKRVERKLAKEAGITEPDDLDIELDEFGVPINRPGAIDDADANAEAAPGSPDRPAPSGQAAGRPNKVGPPETPPKE